jgi:hypothetical protein
MKKSNLYSSSSEVSDFDRLCFIINIVDINKPANNLKLNSGYKVSPSAFYLFLYFGLFALQQLEHDFGSLFTQIETTRNLVQTHEPRNCGHLIVLTVLNLVHHVVV